jgi:DNA replication protein DnaC
MADPLLDRLRQMLPTAECLYHRLILLVGASGSGKTVLMQNLAQELNTSVMNINLSLSELLLELTAVQRAIRLPGLLRELVDGAPKPVLLDNLEILFDPDLKQDPFRLLQSISRNQTIIATWNGTYHNKKLVYADINHPEYRKYDPEDAIIVCMNE